MNYHACLGTYAGKTGTFVIRAWYYPGALEALNRLLGIQLPVSIQYNTLAEA